MVQHRSGDKHEGKHWIGDRGIKGGLQFGDMEREVDDESRGEYPISLLCCVKRRIYERKNDDDVDCKIHREPHESIVDQLVNKYIVRPVKPRLIAILILQESVVVIHLKYPLEIVRSPAENRAIVYRLLGHLPYERPCCRRLAQIRFAQVSTMREERKSCESCGQESEGEECIARLCLFARILDARDKPQRAKHEEREEDRK